MGDYTNGQLYVYSCPPEQVHPFLQFIDEHGLEEDWTSSTAEERQRRAGVLRMRQCYGQNEVRLDMADEATKLAEEAPDSVFAAWTDPKYEWMGTVTMYVPTLGIFSASCDADGNASPTTETLIAAIDELPDTAGKAEVKAAIGKVMGTPWNEAIAALTKDKPPNGVVVAQDPTYFAEFKPQAWQGDQAVDVDAEGDNEWDCTVLVKQRWSYFAQLILDSYDDYPLHGAVDRDDVLKNDPAAPEWVRNWVGPFTIRVFGQED